METKQIIKILEDIKSRSTERHVKDSLYDLISKLDTEDVLPEGPSEQDILDKMKEIEEEVLGK